jgi:glycerophosphoryl diester phosphodiesterase
MRLRPLLFVLVTVCVCVALGACGERERGPAANTEDRHTQDTPVQDTPVQDMQMSEPLRPPLPKRLRALPRPWIIAHRGASANAPENTLPAFQAALDAHADLVELDTHHSRDDRPVVFHDRMLDRTTDAQARWGGRSLSLARYPLAALQVLDAGTWFDARFAGTPIPTLEEALALIQPAATTLIERKTGDAATLTHLLETEDVTSAVIVQAFDWDFLEALRALAPRVPLAALGKGSLSDAALERVVGLAALAVVWRDSDVHAALVDRIHARGLQCWVYTVDDPERARTLRDLGVDAVITNQPAALRTVLH